MAWIFSANQVKPGDLRQLKKRPTVHSSIQASPCTCDAASASIGSWSVVIEQSAHRRADRNGHAESSVLTLQPLTASWSEPDSTHGGRERVDTSYQMSTFPSMGLIGPLLSGSRVHDTWCSVIDDREASVSCYHLLAYFSLSLSPCYTYPSFIACSIFFNL